MNEFDDGTIGITKDIHAIGVYDEPDDGLINEFERTDLSLRSGQIKTRFQPPSSTLLMDTEPTTPTSYSDADKRSRSLTSLRRRHWSASSNRSSSAMSTISHGAKERLERYSRPVACSTTNSTINLQEKRVESISYVKSTSLKTNSVLMNHALSNNDKTTIKNKLEKSKKHRSNINLSTSVCSMLSSSGKQFKKSVNDLLNVTTNKLATRIDEESTKENKIKLSKSQIVSPGVPTGYSKKLKRLKNTLIKTKNTLFNRKNLLKSNDIPTQVHKSNLNRQSVSSPSLSKLNFTSVDNPTCSKFDQALDANQSFANNLRSKFIKRSRSKLNNKSTDNLNSTALSSKLSNTVIGNSAMINNKRPRFY